MKELHFEPEILEKHLARNPTAILTARNKRKGKPGDLFTIEGYGVWELVTIGTPFNIPSYCRDFYFLEGFNTQFELYSILRRLYNADMVYPHIFNRIKTEEEAKQTSLDIFGGKKE